jgi:hypothetical protein
LHTKQLKQGLAHDYVKKVITIVITIVKLLLLWESGGTASINRTVNGYESVDFGMADTISGPAINKVFRTFILTQDRVLLTKYTPRFCCAGILYN